MNIYIASFLFILIVGGIIGFVIYVGIILGKQEKVRNGLPKYTFKTFLKELGLYDEFEAASSLPSQILGTDKKENDKSYKKYIKKAEYIESIYDINGEEVLYRFKEKTNVGKLMWGLIIAVPSAIIYVFTHFSHWISTAADYTSDASGKDYVLKLIIWGLVLCTIFIIPAFVNAARAKDTKSHKSWAISENYFIQVYEGVIELEINKKDIKFVDFNGYEIIVDLLPTVDNYLAEEECDRDKIIMENVTDAEEVYKILEAWLAKA